MMKMSKKDSELIDRLRGASILRVVLGHLGLSWIFLPYSSYVGIFLPVLFFCSGYLFIHLFFKSKSTWSFFAKRILGIVLPFYVIYSFALAIEAIYTSSVSSFTFQHLLRVLLVAPEPSETPYPLGQIWYLRVLLFCTLICPVFFLLTKHSRYTLLLPVIIGFALSATQTVIKVHSSFYFLGHNLFQEVVYGSFFFFGSFIFFTNWRNHFNVILVGTACSLFFAAFTHQWTNGSYVLGDHAYAPNIFYFTLGLTGILLALLLSPTLEWLCSTSKLVDKLLEYCGKHSYGIYLNHSFFIIFTEHYFGLKSVMDQPELAALKIILVVSASLAAAYPITFVSRMITNLIFPKKVS